MTGRPRTAPQAAGRLPGLVVLVALLHAALLSLWEGRHEAAVERASAGAVVRLLPVPAGPVALPVRGDEPRRPVREGIAAPAARGEALPVRAAPTVPVAPVVAAEPAAAPAEATLDGEPPPLYPTRVPAPALLRFAARAGAGVDGDAELRWQHDGERYRLALRVAGPSRPLLEQLSEGGFDAAGLAPLRFLDRRRGRNVGAAHFRRDIGRIAFSGPSVDYPAWPGAQDRLAWLPQLVAVLAAANEPPAEVRFFVADARGIARTWVFRAEGSEQVQTASGAVMALKFTREPSRADDLRVAVWLDPAAGGWPARIEFVVPISGVALTLARIGDGPVQPPPGAPGP